MTDLASQFARIRSSDQVSLEDREYLRRRKEFAEKLGQPDLFQYIDQFGLYAGTQTLASRLVAYEVIKQSVTIPGHVIEFGTWHGSNLLFMAKLLRLLQPSSLKQVFGFDNFSGLPKPVSLDGAAAESTVGKYKGDEEILRAAIDLYNLNDNVHLIVGDATETIPAFEDYFPEALVSLAWVDFDLYEPCKAALSFLAKRLAVGGIIVLDEAISRAWPGETVAMLEFLESHSGHFRMQANTLGRQPTMWLGTRKLNDIGTFLFFR